MRRPMLPYLSLFQIKQLHIRVDLVGVLLGTLGMHWGGKIACFGVIMLFVHAIRKQYIFLIILLIFRLLLLLYVLFQGFKQKISLFMLLCPAHGFCFILLGSWKGYLPFNFSPRITELIS